MPARSTFLSFFCLALAACASGASSGGDEAGFTPTEETGGSAGETSNEGGSSGSGKGGSSSAGKGGGSGKGGSSDAGKGGSSDAGKGGSGDSGKGGSGDAGKGGSSDAGKGGSGDAGKGGSGDAGKGDAGSGGSGAGGVHAGSGGSGGSPAGSGGSGGSGGGGSSGSGGGSTCEDKGVEPNESEGLAAPACQPAPCEITGADGDGTIGYGGPHQVIFGTVGKGDVDYFKFHGKDTTFSVTNPTAKTSDSNVKLCIFTACATETNAHQCTSNGSQFEKSEGGLQGCCITGPGEVASDHDCAGSITDDDSADIFIRVTPIGDVCASYSVDFHF